jgi:TolA-binding protein
MLRPLRVSPLLLLVACSHYAQEDGERLSNEVFALQSQVKALQESMTRAEKTNQERGKQLDGMAKEFEQLGDLARRNSADLGAEVDRIREDIARTRSLAERLEELETKVNKVTDEFVSIDAKARDSEAEKQAAIERERLLSSPEALFGAVAGLINNQKPADARRLLREFEKRAKTETRLQSYLPKVQYLLAETYYAEGNYQLAATEYNNVRKRFPKSGEVADALFQLGQCFERLKLPEDAKLFYRELQKKYKSSDAAKKAAARLKAL